VPLRTSDLIEDFAPIFEHMQVAFPFEDGGVRSRDGLSQVYGTLEWVVDVSVSMPDFDRNADS
jgi:hypothetical protein